MARDKTRLDYGVHAVQHALDHAPEDILELWLADTRKSSRELQSIIETAGRHGISIQKVSARSLDELTAAGNHQGVAIRRRPPAALHEEALETLLARQPGVSWLFLVLDGVQDPHNLGACLRSADAAGVHAVIAPRDNAVGLNATVSKVASGAAETVPFITVTNLARTLRSLQEAGIWLVGTDDAAESLIYDIDLTGDVAIVMGAEGRGLRQNTRRHCDHLARLPMQGSVDSLNVSVAAGIVLFESVRQRRA